MPVRYVDLPDNLLGSISLPALSVFTGAFSLELVLTALTLAFVASAETLLSATAVDQMHDGPRTNYDRELLSQGIGNMLAGVLGGLPMTGVIVRSATNVAAGAKTRKSAMMHGLWLLILVAALPGVLRMVPTASLAAVLVFTGYKLVNPQNIRNLRRYGLAPVAIYAITVLTIVTTDLLTGILVGIGCSVLKVLYALTHLEIRVLRDAVRNRIDVEILGAATFIRLPKLVDALEALPADAEVHLHLSRMNYIDHACMDAIANWEKQRTARDSKVVIEREELMNQYQAQNRFSPVPAVAEVVGSASR